MTSPVVLPDASDKNSLLPNTYPRPPGFVVLSNSRLSATKSFAFAPMTLGTKSPSPFRNHAISSPKSIVISMSPASRPVLWNRLLKKAGYHLSPSRTYPILEP